MILRSFREYTFLVISISALLRLLMIGQVGLGDDEAHYWMWSQHLDWSYFDHPPMVAWIIALFTEIGGHHEFFVRIGAVLLFALASFGAFHLGTAIQDEKTGFMTVLFLNISPVFSFLGSVLMVPDSSLGAAWIFFILFFYRAIQEPDRLRYWLLSGLTLGVALLSKYNAVLLPLSAFLYLLVSPKKRNLLYRKEPYIALALGFLIVMPVIVWNARHDWASFGFQFNHGLGVDPSFSLTLFFQILGAQFAYISPILFVLSFIALFLSGMRGFGNRDEKHLFLFFFGAPTLFLFDMIGSFHRILPHWPALGFVTPFISLAIWMDIRPNLKPWRTPAIVFGLVLTLIIPIQALTGLIPITHFIRSNADPTNDLYGWPEAAREINRLQAEMTSERSSFIYSYKFLIADQIGFYTGQAYGIYCFNEDKTQFDFWDDPDKLKGQNGLFVTDNRYDIDPVEKFGKLFQRIEKESPVRIYRRGELIRTFYFYKSYGFKGLKS
ncbi:MAG: glycosyltransferase family 39 protein [Nitrospirae bacterium]|nr:glycosyltransferase family 39 protein [Nitrospirota bacterium]MBI3593549.1 glycosyltransferase family 39 protein [Nitrospirota bacterium]